MRRSRVGAEGSKMVGKIAPKFTNLATTLVVADADATGVTPKRPAMTVCKSLLQLFWGEVSLGCEGTKDRVEISILTSRVVRDRSKSRCSFRLMRIPVMREKASDELI